MKTLVENQSGRKVKKRTDRRLEFCEDEFTELCAQAGTARHKTLPDRPQQNGVAERLNIPLLESLMYDL